MGWTYYIDKESGEDVWDPFEFVLRPESLGKSPKQDKNNFNSEPKLDFSPDSFLRHCINKEFMRPEHNKFRKSFFQTFTKEEILFLKN